MKSWTHDFCLLADTKQAVTSGLNQLSPLNEAGLGKKKIVFPDKGSKFSKLKSVLKTEYPKLSSQDGAFELARAEGGGYSRPLCVIPIPPEGYSIPYLKEMVAPTTTIYIRPMKDYLSTDKTSIPITESSPVTECAICH